jgi:hypothetical protein
MRPEDKAGFRQSFEVASDRVNGDVEQLAGLLHGQLSPILHELENLIESLFDEYGFPLTPTANPPQGCTFHPRCAHAIERCRVEVPPLRECEPGRLVSCHRAEELTLKGIA